MPALPFTYMKFRRIACVALPLVLIFSPALAQEEIPWEITEAIIERGEGARSELLLHWSQGQDTNSQGQGQGKEPTSAHQSQSSVEVREPISGPTVGKRRGPPQGYTCPTPWRIALTFDDGPFPHHTSSILDILAEKQVKATFFLVGRQIKAHPGIVRRIYEDGHEIALHSHSHPDMSKLSEQQQLWEMEKARHSLEGALPEATPIWWRAPYGALTDFGVRTGRDMGMKHLGWSIDTQDWRRPTASEYLHGVINRARDGDVVLMHDHARITRVVLGELIDELHYAGFEMRTVSELTQPGCPRLVEAPDSDDHSPSGAG